MKYQDIKSILVNALLKQCPQFEAGELETVVSHWLHGQNLSLPLLTDVTRSLLFGH